MKKLWPHIILIPLLLTIPIVSSPDFDGTLSVFKVSPFQREFIRFVLVIIFFYSKKKYLPFTVCILICFGIMVFIPNYLSSENIFSGQPSPMQMRPPQIHPHENFLHPPIERRPPFENFGPRNEASYRQMIFSSVLPFLFSFLSSLFIWSVQKPKQNYST